MNFSHIICGDLVQAGLLKNRKEEERNKRKGKTKRIDYVPN